MVSRRLPLLLAFLLALPVGLAIKPAAQAQLLLRPGKEFRSLNTATYEVAIQKNGRVDVHFVTGGAVFANAFPMVWFDGKAEPELLEVDGRYSERRGVDDRLGRGQGMVLQKGACEWHLRVYPTEPFFAVQVAYTNTSDEPVRVRALMPWCVGEPKRGALNLGAETAESVILAPRRMQPARILQDGAEGAGRLAVINRTTGRSLVAGFITQEQAETTVRIDRGENSEVFDLFRATCVFDPPIEVAPGEQLRSDVLYLAIAEPGVLDGLERFAKAAAVANDFDPRLPISADGWVLGSAPDQPLTTERITAIAHKMAADLAPYGLNHLVIDAAPAEIAGDVPEMLNQVHERGLTMSVAASGDGAPEFDGVVLDLQTPPLDAFSVAEGRRYLHSVRAKLGARSLVIARAGGPPPLWPVDVLLPETTPREGWRSEFPSTVPGAVESVRAAARDYYHSPYLWRQAAGPVPIAALSAHAGDTALTRDQTVAWLTAQALLGGPVLFSGEAEDLGDAAVSVLRRLVPAPGRPARPADLFDGGTPRVWALDAQLPAGSWTVAAVFNWNASASQRLTLPFEVLGMDPTTPYTVFDFWQNAYYGVARSSMYVDNPPGSVRVLGFRRYRDRPMLLASDSHFMQGMDHTAIAWDPAQRTLQGQFEAVAETEYTLSVLVPERFDVGEVDTSGSLLATTHDGAVLKIRIRAESTGKANWRAAFRDSPTGS